MNRRFRLLATICAAMATFVLVVHVRSSRRDHQLTRQTLGRLFAVATALDAHYFDHGTFPERPLSRLVTIRDALEPTYIRTLPVDDAFGHDLWYVSNGTTFALWSLSANGAPDIVPTGGPSTSSDADIIMTNTVYGPLFWQAPEGFDSIVASPDPFAIICSECPALLTPVLRGRSDPFLWRNRVAISSHLARLTPACSGLASLAADARRWAAGQSCALGLSAFVPALHAFGDSAS